MATIKTTRVWNGLPVDEYTDTSSGTIMIRSQGILDSEGDLLASSDRNGNWKYEDQSGFLRRYNNAQRSQGKPILSQEDFDSKFYTEGTELFNIDRSSSLNSESNYNNPTEFKSNTEAFYENGVPGVRSPKTKKVNNSNGDSVDDSTEDDVEDSQNGWLSTINQKL